MKGAVSTCKSMSPIALAGTATAAGVVTAGLSAVQLILSRTPSSPILLDFVRIGLVLAVPTGAVVALVAVAVGLGLRWLAGSIFGFGARVTSVVAGVGVGAILGTALLILGAPLGLTGFDWWPAIPCVAGAFVFGLWSGARDRRH